MIVTLGTDTAAGTATFAGAVVRAEAGGVGAVNANVRGSVRPTGVDWPASKLNAFTAEDGGFTATVEESTVEDERLVFPVVGADGAWNGAPTGTGTAAGSNTAGGKSDAAMLILRGDAAGTAPFKDKFSVSFGAAATTDALLFDVTFAPGDT